MWRWSSRRDQYSRCGDDSADNEGCWVSRPIGSNKWRHFYDNGSDTNSKCFWVNHQINIKIHQSKSNEFIGRDGLNFYTAGVIQWNYTPYQACFTGIYCIVPLFRLCCVLYFLLWLQQYEDFNQLWICNKGIAFISCFLL